MLVIARRGCEDRVKALFDRWELHSEVIGEVTDDGMARIFDGDVEVACMPIPELTHPPQYRREGLAPAWLTGLQSYDLASIPDLAQNAEEGSLSAEKVLLGLLRSPNIASKRWVYRQYDHQVLTNTVVEPGAGDAAVLRLRGTKRAIALTTDCNGRYCFLDPYAGGAIAVAEAARNVVCTGATPLAITDCLNFGNPEKLDVYFQLEQAIRGMSEACKLLGTPVISGNVSLYNETNGEAVYPTPVVGMLGVLDDVDRRLGLGFNRAGDAVCLLAPAPDLARGTLQGSTEDLAGSEYLTSHQAIVAGRPAIDLDAEHRVQQACLEAAGVGLLSAAHDCSDGGLAVALVESCVAGGQGLDASGIALEGRLDAALFGERQSRIVVALAPENVVALTDVASRHGAGVLRLGTVSGSRLIIGNAIDVALGDLRYVYEGSLEAAVSSPAEQAKVAARPNHPPA
jgi:phosphoribosylformylglycinamidine synthase